jgi:hypothetical protein
MEDVSEHIFKCTSEFKKKIAVKKPKVTLTKKDKLIQKAFETTKWDGYGKGVGELVNAMLGKTVCDINRYRDNEEHWLDKGVAVVPLKCTNAHNYKIGNVCISTGDYNYCIHKNGTKGNHLGIDHDEYFRFATKTEISDFITKKNIDIIRTNCM